MADTVEGFDGLPVGDGQPVVAADPADDALRLFDAVSAPRAVASLSDQYMVPPFSVLDRRAGRWQTRAGQWKKLGMEGEIGLRSEDGREGVRAFNTDKTGDALDGGFSDRASVSIFDPFLCEIAYSWFCPKGGTVLDPFAGGSVRGIVAAALGRRYIGIDLSRRQVDANREQADRILGHGDGEPEPEWHVADSRSLLSGLDRHVAQMMFTCPPYGDLEVYSDDPADLSQMPPAGFDNAYADILAGAVRGLADDSFAAVVVGNYRDKGGTLRDLVGITVRAMADAGADYYDKAVILDPPGTAPWRAPRQFDASRKLVRVHQHLLVFVKGDPRKAATKVAA